MRSLRRSTRERLALGRLVRILFPLIDLLLELLCLFLIRKAQASQTVLQLERVEERPVLVVLERVVDFLVPEDATVGGRDVHELDEVGVTHKIIGEDCSALESSVDPSTPFRRVSDVEFGNRNGVDLVGSLGNCALDSLLVVVGQDRGHSGGVEGKSAWAECFRSRVPGLFAPGIRGLVTGLLAEQSESAAVG
jgi:hypothetical protein